MNETEFQEKAARLERLKEALLASPHETDADWRERFRLLGEIDALEAELEGAADIHARGRSTAAPTTSTANNGGQHTESVAGNDEPDTTGNPAECALGISINDDDDDDDDSTDPDAPVVFIGDIGAFHTGEGGPIGIGAPPDPVRFIKIWMELREAGFLIVHTREYWNRIEPCPQPAIPWKRPARWEWRPHKKAKAKHTYPPENENPLPV